MKLVFFIIVLSLYIGIIYLIRKNILGLMIFVVMNIGIFSLVFPMILSNMYSVTDDKIIIKTIFSSEQILNYASGVFSFIGTIFLGTIAFWQNKQLHNESKKKDKIIFNLENEKMRLLYMPSFVHQTAKLSDWSIEEKIINNIHTYIMDNERGYLFSIQDNLIEWAKQDMFPAIPDVRVREVMAITNCGNESAHQVKLQMNIGDKVFECDKAMSVKKDDSLFLFLSWNKDIEINEEMFLTIRYFDTFQNVYTQKFKILEKDGERLLKSFSDVELIVKSEMMKITTLC